MVATTETKGMAYTNSRQILGIYQSGRAVDQVARSHDAVADGEGT